MSPSRPDAVVTRTWLPTLQRDHVAGLALLVPAGAVLVGLLLTQPPALAGAVVVGLAGFAILARSPFLGLLAIVFLVQLGGLVEAALGSFEAVFLELLAAATVAAMLVHVVRRPRRERLAPDTLVFRMALLYAIVVVVSYLLAENGRAAEREVAKRLALVVLLYLITWVTRTFAQVRLLVIAVAASTALSGAISFAGDATGQRLIRAGDASDADVAGRQAGAASTNATTASQMMLAGTGIAALLALRRGRGQPWFAVAALAGASGIILSEARSSAVVGLFGIAWLLFKQRRHRRLPAILLTAVLLGAMSLPLLPDSQLERLETLLNPSEDYTLGRRLGYQLVGFDLLASNPVFGVGAGNFRYLYMSDEYRFVPNRTLEVRELHNMYLSVAVQSGTLGFVCFVGMLGAALHGLSRVRRESPGTEVAAYAEALHFGFALYLLACSVAPATTNKLTWTLPGLAAALTAVVDSRRDPATERGT